MARERYPHLAPELRTLTGDALSLWGNATERHRALTAILDAWETGSLNLEALVARVDAAVVAGLLALGLPRGAVAATRVTDAAGRWFGRKSRDCTLLLAGDGLRYTLRALGQPDAAWRTWVHESLHARQAYSPTAGDEYRLAPGYEEGLAESLVRLVVQDKASIALVEGRFEYYVQAYRTLARAVELDPEELWRTLWQHAPGEVREAFTGAVERLRRADARPGLTASQQAGLLGVADQLLRGDRARSEPNEGVMMALWEAALR
jgi:hypothetical protein